MRRRSDVQAAAVDTRQTSIPGTETKAPEPTSEPPPSSPRPRATTDILPKHVSVDHGNVFVKCPDCGLNQNVDAAKHKVMPNGVNLLHCFRCNGLVDPDEELTPEFITRLKATYANTRAGASAPSTPAEAPTKPDSPAAKAASEAPTNKLPPQAPPAKEPSKPVPQCKHPTANGGWCGTPLTETNAGWFAPCGHPQPTNVKSSPETISRPVDSRMPSTADGETVTVCHGEEKFSPRQYQSFSIGPYFRTTRILPGETATQAGQRALAELRAFADTEFKQKAKDYLGRLDWVIAEDRKGGTP